MYARHDMPGSTALGQGIASSTNPSLSTSINTQNTSQPQNPAVSAYQPGSQPTYSREDIQRRVAQKLKDEGHITITKAQLDKAVDEAYRRIHQQAASAQAASAQAAPPPYSKHGPQPNTTDDRGFSMTATAGPKPGTEYGQYLYQR